jgi:hypothetical protein
MSMTDLVTALAAVMLGQFGHPVPAGLVAVAKGNPVTFVQYCAELSVPCGLEILETDFARGWSTASEIGRVGTVLASDVIRAFNNTHSDYKAADLDGVIVIRPSQQRARYLDSIARVGTLHERGLMTLGEHLFAPLDPALTKPGGRGGSYASPTGVEVDRGEDVELTIQADGRPVIDILNEMATLGPGHSWLVVTANEAIPRVVRFGFVHRYGTTTELRIGKPAELR